MTAAEERAGLLASIIDNPKDVTNRLVYADWLEENGDPFQAMLVRKYRDGGKPLKTAACEPNAWDMLAGSARQPRGFLAWCRASIPPMGYSRSFAFGCKFYQGLLTEVYCRKHWWLTHGPDMVARFPVSYVYAIDVRHQKISIGIGAEQTLHSTPADLPPAVRGFLPKGARQSGGVPLYDGDARSELAAYEALLEWARSEAAKPSGNVS